MGLYDSYQSPHLFLLVGANPLPNYVAIQLLRPPTGQVYLIHTAETELIAERICQVSALVRGQNATLIKVNTDSTSQMVSAIEGHARGKAGLGLNYTGGTKRMVVAAQQAIQHSAQLYHEIPTFSYLDARTLRIAIDKAGQNTILLPAATAITLSFANLLQLHGFTIAHPPPRTPLADQVDGLYSALMKTPHRDFRAWWNQAKHGMGGRTGEILLPQDARLAPLATYWHGFRDVSTLAAHWQTNVGRLSAWFNNMGLEDYTLWALQQRQSETEVSYTAMNILPVELGFEFDVVALRGYQLFALSCANANDKETIKQKLFEVFIRARQMGGDEARIAVVCRAPAHDELRTPSAIEQEVRREWDRDGKIRIFGEEHLLDLPAHLAEWILTQASP